MAIALRGVDRLPRGPKRDFGVALHALYDSAGQPAARVVSRATYRRPNAQIESVSHETVSSTLRGDILPAWPKVQAMVTVLVDRAVAELDLDAEITRFHQLWLAARQASDPASAPDPPPANPGPVRVSGPAPAGPAPVPPVRTALGNERIVGPLPERNPDFSGRELLLDTMREYHLAQPSVPLVLYGLGGVGKTQLAREYAHRNEPDYDLVWWVPAEPVEAARNALVLLAERLGLPLRSAAEQTIRGVLNELESRRMRFLLVFDGAEGDSVRGMIPGIGGNVLVTSRDSTWAADSTNTRLEVPDFDEAEAIQFLRKRDPGMTGQQATEVAHRAGRLPLALEQLAALRLGSGWSWDEMLPRLDEPDLRLLADAAEPAHYPNTVAASLQLALEQLRRANPNAVLVFELFAWFGSEPVSVSLLRHGARAAVSPELQRTTSDQVVLNRVVEAISRFGLGRLHAEDQRIEVQPLMRLALRDALSAADRDRAQRNVHAILVAADPGHPDDAMWELHKAMAPHVLPSGLIHSSLPGAHRAVYHQVRYRYLLGDHEGARRLGQAAVTAWQEAGVLGRDAEMVLLTQREWANALRGLGRYRESRRLNEDALARLRASAQYGEGHRYTFDTARSYAADLRIAGEYDAALRLDEASHRRYVQEHTDADDLATTIHHNMAVSYRLLGDFRRAEEIDREELDRRRQRHGPDHRRTQLSRNALAEDLLGLSRFREVLELDWSEPVTAGAGSRPPGMLLAARTMGIAHRRLGEYEPAEALLQAHLAECAAAFGREHGFTLAAMMSYANVMRDRGRLGPAYATAVDAIVGYKNAFGADNPLTLAAQVNLAAILRAQGERRQARRIDETAHEKLAGQLGPVHPFAIAAGVNLANDLGTAGDQAAARAVAEASYRSARTGRGDQHFDTLVAAANVVACRAPDGPSSDEVLAALRRTVGPTHPIVREVAAGEYVECDVEPPSL